MKNRVTKLLLLVLSLALLVGGAVGISVSAENAAPEIISKNVMDTGDFCLMFAVDPATVAGEDVTLRVYDRDPSDADKKLAFEETKAVTATEDIDLDGDRTPETAVIVFTTAGVAAKDFADVWYIETESAGAKKVITYSVMEYAFERLYRDGAVLASDKDADLYSYYQKEFYLGMLNMGSAAQNLHVNYGKAEAERERLVKEYTYVSVLDGTFTAGETTADRGFVEANTSITLNANDTEAIKGWSIFTYGQNGVEIDRKVANDGDTITVTGNTVVIPYEIGVTAGKYFAEVGVADYNFTGKDWKFIQPANGFMAHTKLTGASEAETNRNYAMYGFVDSGDDHGTVFQLAKDEQDYNFAMLAHFPVREIAQDANCLVFEFDMKFNDGFGCYDSTEAAKKLYSAMIFMWNSQDLATAAGKTASATSLNPLLKANMVLYDEDGNFVEETFETGVSNGVTQSGTYKTGGDVLRFEGVTDNTYDIKQGEWHNFCYEIYTDVNKVVCYIDGVAVHEYSINTSIDISAVNTNSVQFEPRFRDADFMFDNIFSGKVKKEYKAQ